MLLKLFHLNIEGGRVLDSVIAYIKEQDFDIVHLQEVNAGKFSKTGINNFEDIKQGTGYQGELAITQYMKGDSSSSFGNATFFKPGLFYVQKEIIWLKRTEEIDYDVYETKNKDFLRQLPRNGIALLFSLDTQPIWFVNAHLAWGPDSLDEPHKVEQGKILYQFLQSLEEPFVFSADFNVDKNSEIVRSIDTLAVNHAAVAKITNTLNPHLHRAQHLFPQGLAVDFLYTSTTLRTRDFRLIDTPDLSDHLGLRITIEV